MDCNDYKLLPRGPAGGLPIKIVLRGVIKRVQCKMIACKLSWCSCIRDGTKRDGNLHDELKRREASGTKGLATRPQAGKRFRDFILKTLTHKLQPHNLGGTHFSFSHCLLSHTHTLTPCSHWQARTGAVRACQWGWGAPAAARMRQTWTLGGGRMGCPSQGYGPVRVCPRP